MLEPTPQVRRRREASLAQLVEQLHVSLARMETLDIGVLLQEMLDVIVDGQVRELLRGHLPLLHGALLLQRGPGRWSRTNLRLGRGLCGRGCRHAPLEGLEFVEVLRTGKALLRKLRQQVLDGECAQGLLGVADAQVHRERRHLHLADDSDVVPLRQLALPDLLGQRLAAEVAFCVKATDDELSLEPLCIAEGFLANGHDQALSGRQPERPLPGEVLREDCHEALHRAEDRAMDDDGTLEACLQLALTPNHLALRVLLHCALEFGLVLVGGRLVVDALPSVLQVEPDGVVEVQLDGAALVLSLHGVCQPDVDLRPVKRAVARVQRPLLAGLVQGGLELGLGVVPNLLRAQGLLGPRRQGEGRVEAEEAVDVVQEVEPCEDLLLNLVRPDEQVRVVLLEPPDSGEACERAARLIPV
mmetsp:Transcript_86686/g.169604  ORF Transcript_86686/g.169604 Transcript_86686/m.169604 type:complete len:415 (-) Transcript_86686:1412-2656(-)